MSRRIGRRRRYDRRWKNGDIHEDSVPSPRRAKLARILYRDPDEARGLSSVQYMTADPNDGPDR